MQGLVLGMHHQLWKSRWLSAADQRRGSIDLLGRSSGLPEQFAALPSCFINRTNMSPCQQTH